MKFSTVQPTMEAERLAKANPHATPLNHQIVIFSN